MDCTNVPGITVKRNLQGRGASENRFVRLLNGMAGYSRYGVHNPSLVNLCRGVVERVLYTRNALGELSKPLCALPGAFKALCSIRNRVVKHTRPTTAVDIEDYPSLYHCARKRELYTRAVSSLSQEAISRRDARVSTFVKAEKVNFSTKPDPPPRVIQPRSPRYNACVGRFLKPLEKALFLGFAQAFGYVVISKGLNATGTAQLLRENWDQFEEPIAIGLDASRFDQHVGVEALKFEHGFYNLIFQSPELAELLSWQLHNKGVAFVGDARVTYEVDGCRMSGDINTSMGNCIIMCCIVLAFLEHKGLTARLTNNGDDCIVILEKRDARLMDGIDEWFKMFGFKLTKEPAVSVFEKIEFCQTQPVYCEDGWRMVRNPFTATSKDIVSMLGWNGPVEFSQWCGAIGTCGLALCRGVPFWESFYARFKGDVSEHVIDRFQKSGLGYTSKSMNSTASITEASRYSFWLAFGLTPDEQIALEDIEVDISYGEGPTPLIFGDITSLSPLLQYAVTQN